MCLFPPQDNGVDPYAGMSERQRKLHELQARMKQSRKANQNAVIAERRREKVGGCACFQAVALGDSMTWRSLMWFSKRAKTSSRK